MSDEKNEAVCSLARAALLLDDGIENLEQAMLEAQLALIWMRKLPGGKEATEKLITRALAELERRAKERGE